MNHFILTISIMAITISCQSNYNYNAVGSNINTALRKYYGGKHDLHRFTEGSEHISKTTASGGFFVVAAGFDYQSNNSMRTMATFYWKTYKGHFIREYVPIEMFRFQIDTTEIPYIEFEYRTQLEEFRDETSIDDWLYSFDCRDYHDRNFRRYVQHIVVHCQEKDFPKQIQF